MECMHSFGMRRQNIIRNKVLKQEEPYGSLQLHSFQMVRQLHAINEKYRMQHVCIIEGAETADTLR